MSLRYALRTLSRTPGFTASAVATLALAIGITTVVFTVYDSVALRKLSARAPQEIVRIHWRNGDTSSDQFSWIDYQRLTAFSHSASAFIATSTPLTVVLRLPNSAPGSADVVHVRIVSANYFDALGIKPALGRNFVPGEGPAAVLSHDFWAKKLHADPALYGEALTIHAVSIPILGVAPESFTGTGAPPETPDLWLTASAQTLIMPGTDLIGDHATREWQVLARRNPGVTAGQNNAELAVLSRAWPAQNGKPVQLSAAPATFFQVDGGGFQVFVAVCLILMIAVGLVLLIACVNLINLTASRNAAREHEIAVRLSLGCSRWRLINQFCTETLVLGVVGGAAGFCLSLWACDWIAARAATVFQQITNSSTGLSLNLLPDWRVFAWTAALSILTGIVVGLPPALAASRSSVASALKQGTAGVGFLGAGMRRKRNFLLTAQVASCLVLLTAASLLFRGITRSAVVRAGFDVKHLVLVGINTAPLQGTSSAQLETQRLAIARIEALPEVESVAWADRSPFLGTGSGAFRNENGAALPCIFNGVSDNYFRTLAIPVLSGRTFTQTEIEREAPVAVISDSTAESLWPGKNALGRKITPTADWLTTAAGHPSFTVIGIAKTVRSTYLSKNDEGYVYMPRQLHGASALFLVRTRTNPERCFKSLSKALSEVDVNLLAGTYMVSMEKGPVRLQELMAQAPAMSAAALGALSLLLACMGIYGTVSQLVSQRTREIGIRIALGAARRDITATVASQTLQPVAWGAAAGLLGAFGVSGLLRAFIVMPDVPI